MTWTPGPLVARRRLGAELRQLRDDAGVKLEAVASKLDCSLSKISRLETGKGIPRYRDVRDMLRVYGVAEDDDLGKQLLHWARVGRSSTWWSDYSDVLPPKFDEYVELEWDATRINAYESHVVHGLLQTHEYARAVLERAWPHADPRHVSRLIEVRMRRQAVLASEHHLNFRCVLDESTLLRVVGDEQVMAGQVRHLVDLIANMRIDVRVLPFSAGLVAPNLGSFATLGFEGPIPGVVHEERPGATLVSDDPALFVAQESIFAEIFKAALDRNATLYLLERRLAQAGPQ